MKSIWQGTPNHPRHRTAFTLQRDFPFFFSPTLRKAKKQKNWDSNAIGGSALTPGSYPRFCWVEDPQSGRERFMLVAEAERT
ncbi:uncharacterized protein BDV14DRAFT_183328 [Aspergillus stella-maris]|uniref:uncharacterized protein n=1 Tax=Aspergillus stella-maris TaxID=1810926 RepID=UPI003CCD01F9